CIETKFMKQSLFSILLLLFITTCFAQEDIEDYLLFSPQKMEIEPGLNAFEGFQTDTIKKAVQKSIEEQSAGKWVLKIKDKPVKIYFEIDAGLNHHDEFHINLTADEINLIAKNKNALRYGKQTLLQLMDYATAKN